MCLIVLKPKGANNSLSKDKFVNALKTNPHGIGIAYSDGGKLQIEKFANPKDMADEIYAKIENKDAYLIHFRYATHGEKNEENVHPFLITEGLCVAHNGVISKYPEINKAWSDTRNFVEGVIKPYIKEHGKESYKSKDFIEFVESQIGSGKMVFVDENMDYSIANEKAGSWVDGCWYSNTYSVESYEEKQKKWAKEYEEKYGKWDNKSYSSYDDYYGDYGYGYGNYNNYEDDYSYLKGSLTMDEINKYIADEVANGYNYGEEIPYELEMDDSQPMDTDKYYEMLFRISEQIKKGIYKGTQPVQWELILDKDDIDYLLKKEDYGTADNFSDAEYAILEKFTKANRTYLKKTEFTPEEQEIANEMATKGLLTIKSVKDFTIYKLSDKLAQELVY